MPTAAKIWAANLLLGGLFLAQVGFGYSIRGLQPYWTVLPPVPSEQATAAQAFGDNEFLYRLFVMDLQNFGDTGGHWSALKDYNIEQVIEWLHALDRLDAEAEHHVTLAARYFSQTQNTQDLVPLVAYIRGHVQQNPKKLQWLSEAIFLAQKRLNDPALALAIADQLGTYDFPEMSPIAYQLPAIMHETAGDFGGAAVYMERALRILRPRVREDEANYMAEYVAQMRAKALQQNNSLK